MRPFRLLALLSLLAPAMLSAEVLRESTRPMPQMEPGARAVVIVSTGEVFGVRRIGVTVFENHAVAMPVPAWKLDEQLEVSTAQVLNQRAGLVAQALGDATLRADFHDFNAISAASRKDQERMRAAVRKIGEQLKVDYVIVVAADGGIADPFFETGVRISGFGIAQDERPFKPRALLQVHPTLLFFDARSAKQLSFAWQVHALDQAMVPKDRDLSAAEVEGLRSKTLNLFEVAVATIIRDMLEKRADQGRRVPFSILRPSPARYAQQTHVLGVGIQEAGVHPSNDSIRVIDAGVRNARGGIQRVDRREAIRHQSRARGQRGDQPGGFGDEQSLPILARRDPRTLIGIVRRERVPSFGLAEFFHDGLARGERGQGGPELLERAMPGSRIARHHA